MAQEFQAQMAVFNGGWRLYVVVLNAGVTTWPDFSFDRAEPVPTFTERVNALSVLGFEPVPGAEWEWTEYSDDPDDPSTAITMLASMRVRSWTGAGA